ncbi:MAG: phosphoesterase family protein [Candidatus Xenolissoclinum pacificiensis L6]|uniref:Phosphoesterase family protein n=1 Tax=Candidatus Xenolissoclinum pacificiensis L6 TaxID=1401685 RepID=W2V013_9RICK|nr:MAG: phosphoesterase family protein [Candidatus Xenolissoclinum pacificiensis L6]
MQNIIPQIKNIVVLMLENRSFDNIVGWLYDKKISPKQFIIPQGSSPDYYDGLHSLINTDVLNLNGRKPEFVSVTHGTSHYNIPSVDPDHTYQALNKQIYYSREPIEGDTAPLDGFVRQFASQEDVKDPYEVMQMYTPEQLPVTTQLARNFAVSDRWFSSVPTQTLPNRAFLHSGTSEGHVNNSDNYIFDEKTIFEVLDDYQVSWKVYSDSGILPSLVRMNFRNLQKFEYRKQFLNFEDFIKDAEKGELPSYSFLEPMFLITNKLLMNPDNRVTSGHPPYNMFSTEMFIAKVYNTIFSNPKNDDTLLLITYDEHGGIYDHVSPPWGATPPDDKSNPGQYNFSFNRFGIRVPTIAISPWIPEGVVFRSFGAPYDHTSILATIMDWKNIPRHSLRSKRVANAQNISSIFTLDSPRKINRLISTPYNAEASKESITEYENKTASDLEKAILSCYFLYNNQRRQIPIAKSEIIKLLGDCKTKKNIGDKVCELTDQKDIQ